LCGILDKLTLKAKPIRIIGDQDNQRPDKCSSTVFFNVTKFILFDTPLASDGIVVTIPERRGNATFVCVYRPPKVA
jgi:hypothetical protein